MGVFIGYVNSQNCKAWAAENPYNFIKILLHPQKI